MTHKRIAHALLTAALLAGATTPVFAQGILDRMKEDAQRRAENKAVMDAEHPQATKPADTTTTPAAPAAPAAAQPPATAPAAPSTPAQGQ